MPSSAPRRVVQTVTILWAIVFCGGSAWLALSRPDDTTRRILIDEWPFYLCGLIGAISLIVAISAVERLERKP